MVLRYSYCAIPCIRPPLNFRLSITLGGGGALTVLYGIYMKIHVYSTLAKLVVKEEKKENPDPIHYTRVVQTRKHKMTRTPAWVPSLENWNGG